MEPEKRPAPRRLSNIKKLDTPYNNKSREWLRNRLFKDIKSVFVGALREIETRLGKDFPAYEELRSAILRMGNNAVRDMHLAVDNVNVEYIPETEVHQGDGSEGQG